MTDASTIDGSAVAPKTRVRRRSRHRRSNRLDRRIVWAIALVAAVVGAAAPVAPTGTAAVDHVLAAGLAALVTLAASRTTRSPLVWVAGIAAALALGSAWVAFAGIALVFALALGLTSDALVDQRTRWPGAVIGALAIQSLLRAPAAGFFGLPSLVTAVAVAPVLWSGWRSSPPPIRRRVTLSVLAGAVFLVVALVGLGVSGLLARSQVDAAINDARGGLDALRAGDQAGATELFDRSTHEFHDANDQMSAPWAQPARLVPVVAQQATALRSVTSSGGELTRTASVAASTAPYRQLHVRSGQIDLDLLASMQAPVAASAHALEAAQADVASIRSPWLVAPLTANLDRFAEEIDRTRSEAELADEALRVAPGLLGADRVRHYYIAFATPAEMRFQGGFVGAYGILTAAGGQVHLDRSGPIGELSEAPGAADRTLSGPPLYLERYGRLNPARFPQNLTASPDMPDNAAAAAKILPQAGTPPIDGVIYVDPVGLAALLRLTGPVTVTGMTETLTADNAAQYLLRDQYLTGATDTARQDGLTEASRATFDALVSRDLPSPAEIGTDLGPAMRGGHLLFTTFDPTEQAFLSGLGSTGAFLDGAAGAGPTNDPDRESDWFSVRTSNAGGNKIDSFLRREVDYDATVDSTTGDVDATATVTLHNDAPSSGLPGYVIGNLFGLPTGTNRLYLGFYTADQLQSATLDGAPLPIESQHEFAGNVYSSRLDIPPGASITVVFHLSGTERTGPHAVDGYRLGVGHQPLVTDDHLTIRVHLAGSGGLAGSSGAEIDTATLLAAGGDVSPVSTEPSSANVDLVAATDVALHLGFRRQ